MTSRRADADADADRGSMALELTIIAPLFFLLLALVLAYGRYESVAGLTESAARDAARAATQQRNRPDADTVVAEITKETLAEAPSSCSDTRSVTIEGNTFAPGDYVRVVVTCRVDLSDLGLPGVGGGTTIRRTFTSPLDPFRGVDQ